MLGSTQDKKAFSRKQPTCKKLFWVFVAENGLKCMKYKYHKGYVRRKIAQFVKGSQKDKKTD